MYELLAEKGGGMGETIEMVCVCVCGWVGECVCVCVWVSKMGIGSGRV